MAVLWFTTQFRAKTFPEIRQFYSYRVFIFIFFAIKRNVLPSPAIKIEEDGHACSVNIDRVVRTLENVREIDFVHGEALENGPKLHSRKKPRNDEGTTARFSFSPSCIGYLFVPSLADTAASFTGTLFRPGSLALSCNEERR